MASVSPFKVQNSKLDPSISYLGFVISEFDFGRRPVMDGLVIAFTYAVLLIPQRLLYVRLRQVYPNLSDAHLEIFSTEGALIPSRVLMVILNIPGIANTVSNKLIWLPMYSDMAAWSWLVLICAYGFELIKYRGKSLQDTVPLSSMCHHIVAMGCGTWVQYSLKGHTASNNIVLQLLSIAMTGSIAIGGLLNTAYRHSKFFLDRQAHQAHRIHEITTIVAWSRTVTISGTWILLAMQTRIDHKRHQIYGKLGMLAGPVFALVYFLFYSQWRAVFAAHMKRGQTAGSNLGTWCTKLDVCSQIAPLASVLDDLPLKVNIALCVGVFAFLSETVGRGLMETYGHGIESLP